ncbi:imidazole glycerol phosphate synthase subunit HisH [Benzoatithermus flavus]|uniref:Imidazole glycerol phosphate synthase subunit HisH n=1 Tax=Benzoatithermus flavus TaxID=3108223 RepID=A0ABU8XN37_9PROT
MTEVVIVPTGTANIASVMAAFRRLGASPRVSEAAGDVLAASHVMLPGVGAFGASMARLVQHGLDRVLKERIAADRPTIAICVGHQLLFERSEESPGVPGLGVVPGEVGRFPADVRVPQFGWNHVRAGEDSRLLEDGYAYFANSYRATEAPGWTIATATHGGPFVAAMERGNVIGCQFHPELSGAYGAALLSRFLELA